MTERDRDFFLHCFHAGTVRSPFLDVGSMSVNEDMGLTNLREVARDLGIKESLGVDFAAGPGVDIIADFPKPPTQFKEDWPAGPSPAFGSVAIFNVLEHTFDPATILANALSLVRPGGTLLAVTPTIWPIHNYPIDCLRLNPDWFRYFANRHGLEIEQDLFMWLSEDFGLVRVESLRKDGLDQIPTFFQLGKEKSPWRYRMTTGVNRVFPTFFRSNWHPAMVALGVVFKRGD
jgi:hypothetical protein